MTINELPLKNNILVTLLRNLRGKSKYDRIRYVGLQKFFVSVIAETFYSFCHFRVLDPNPVHVNAYRYLYIIKRIPFI